MTDYRQLMRLVLDKVPYREIAAREGCSQRTIAKVEMFGEDPFAEETSSGSGSCQRAA